MNARPRGPVPRLVAPRPVAYPTPGKRKALDICRAFAAGCAGVVAERIPARLLPGAAVFYGVTPATRHLYDQVRDERNGGGHDAGREFFYLDNAYLDPCREVYFRATRGRLQHSGVGESDGKRWRALGLSVQPWRRTGDHILLCPQSDEFMDVVVGYRSWLQDTLNTLRQHTRRELRVRPWNRNKRESYATLPEALENCWALVTFSSASAITAMMHGVPAFCTAHDCIARPVAGTDLTKIETPEYQDLTRWLEVVADCQWTLAEMRDGTAWRMLGGA